MRFDFMNVLLTAKAMLDNPMIHIFVWVVLGDIISGFAKSFMVSSNATKANSTKGLKGLIKHGLVVASMFVVYPYMDALGFITEANLILTFYIVTYLVSITENWGQMGLPVPSWVKNRLDKLKDQSDGGVENEK